MVKTFSKSPQIVEDAMKNVLDRIGWFIMGKASGYAPVKTGALAGSIHTSGVSGRGKNMSVTVGTNIEYAPYQEFGTSRGVRAKLYMTRATDEAKMVSDQYMKEAGDKIVMDLAK